MTLRASGVRLDDGARITRLTGARGPWLLAPQGVRDRTDFTAASLGGWDEMLPTVDAGVVDTDAGVWRLGDHGEAWDRAWVGDASRHAVSVRGLRLTREIEHADGGVTLRYALTNTTSHRLPAQWAAHPQFLLARVTTVDLGASGAWRRVWPAPCERTRTGEVTIDALAEDGHGAKWWGSGNAVRLVRAGGDLLLSWTGLTDVAVWVDRGAFASEPVIAIEPALARGDALHDLVVAGDAPVLEPGATRTWELRLDEV